VPHWSLDGQHIAFYSRVKGKAQIYVIDAEGGSPHRFTNDPFDNMFSNWSREALDLWRLESQWRRPSLEDARAWWRGRAGDKEWRVGHDRVP
jgi:hypothetical protein